MALQREMFLRKKYSHFAPLSQCAIFLLVGSTGCLRPPIRPYVGKWVLNARTSGMPETAAVPIMTLDVQIRHRRLAGSFKRLSNFNEEADGTFNKFTSDSQSWVIDGQRWNRPLLSLRLRQKSDAQYMPMMLIDNQHLILAGFTGVVPPWLFERVASCPPLGLNTPTAETAKQ